MMDYEESQNLSWVWVATTHRNDQPLVYSMGACWANDEPNEMTQKWRLNPATLLCEEKRVRNVPAQH